jgi:hypothetical protein
MLKQIVVGSRQDALTFETDAAYAMISFVGTYPGSQRYAPKIRRPQTFRGRIVIRADDCDARPSEPFTALSAEQAKRLVRFVMRNARHIEVLFIHCGEGIGRSSGAAIALSEALGVPWAHLHETKCWPNEHVRTQITAAFNEIVKGVAADRRRKRSNPSNRYGRHKDFNRPNDGVGAPMNDHRQTPEEDLKRRFARDHPWTPPWGTLPNELPCMVNPHALTDAKPLLERLERAFGARPLGDLLDIAPDAVARCITGRQTMTDDMQRHVIGLHNLLCRMLQTFAPDFAALWLVGSEPILEGKRPIDVLALRGVGPLIEALDGIEAGAYS